MQTLEARPAAGWWGKVPNGLGELALVLGGGVIIGLAARYLPPFLWVPLAALGASAWLAVAHPRRAVQLAVFLVPWQIFLGNVPGGSYTFRLVDFVVGCALLASLMRQPRGLRLAWSLWLLPLLVFVMLAVAAGLAQGDMLAVGKFILDWGVILAFYWLMLLWVPRDWHGLVRVLLWAFGLQAGLAIIQTAVGDFNVIRSALSLPVMNIFFEPDFLRERLMTGDFNFDWHERVFGFGTYLNSIGLGVNLATVGTLALALGLRARRLFGSPYLYASLLLYAGCVVVIKRSGWIGMVVGFMAVMLVNLSTQWRSFKRATVILGLAGLITIPLVAILWGALVERATAQFGWEYSRDRVWPIYVDLVLKRPILGYGPDYPQGSVETGFAAKYGLDYNYAFGLDNTYLHLALVAGLPGLLLVLVPVANAVRHWRPKRSVGPWQLMVGSALAAFMVGGTFMVTLANLQVGGVFFLLLAMARASSYVSEIGVKGG